MKRVAAMCWLVFGMIAAALAASENAVGVRLKDLGRIDGWRENMISGYGLVTGLAGTGDSSRNRATRQSIANVLAEFGLNLPSDQVQSRNVAAVMVMASLPPFAKPGSKLDVTVSSIGDARSLVGGALLLTPLKGPDDRVYVLAQGPVLVGGYSYDLFGNLVQKNHPTAGRIPGGGMIEVGAPTQELAPQGGALFVLAQADYTTASRVAEAINRAFGRRLAQPKDAASVEIVMPASESRPDAVAFLTRIENLQIEPGGRARVVVNERTGTVVAGGDVRISRVTISHGDLKVSIATDFLVSQPYVPIIGRPGPGGRTVVVPQTRVDVSENESQSVTLAGKSNTVADLVNALAKIRTSPRDLIAILQGVIAAGAMHAELILQ